MLETYPAHAAFNAPRWGNGYPSSRPQGRHFQPILSKPPLRKQRKTASEISCTGAGHLTKLHLARATETKIGVSNPPTSQTYKASMTRKQLRLGSAFYRQPHVRSYKASAVRKQLRRDKVFQAKDGTLQSFRFAKATEASSCGSSRVARATYKASTPRKQLRLGRILPEA